ncbi:MAG: FAD-dependent oxidoreductase [Planctomycetes bacterium]|nr:FAD-dependent oxidoreductase [Planctomycetota bacterium]
MSPTTPTILIVGGVAGGASAATRARRMNEHARIVMFEKDAYVSFANCGLPYHLGGEIPDREALLVAKPELFEKRFRIEVRTRTEVLSIDRAARTVQVKDHATGKVSTEHFDKLILAPGAAPIVPSMPGANAKGVFTLRNLDDTDRIAAAMPAAKHAVVVGGGFIGLEVAEQFRHRGMNVTLVEMQPQVLPLLDAEMAEPLHREIETRGVRLELGRGIASIEEKDGAAAAVVLTDGTRVPADLVLLGLGVRPNVKLAQDAGLALGTSGGIATDAHMRTNDTDIYAVGDAAEYAYGPTGGRMRVPLAGPANRTGRLAGEHAATGGAAVAPAAWGTSIVRVFGKTAGITGMSRRAALKAGLDARAVHITANHHAGYFPGAEPMVLKLVYEAATGRVLGAQAVGGAGVDKRLDIIATLLHFHGTVHDLSQLDLAYAPPFGSAKDPVHMAGFAAQNDLAGVSRLLPPDTDLASYQVVDVRSPEESARHPLANAPHAKKIPLEQLRACLGELDATKPTVVSCQTGVRSHIGTRILAQNGFAQVFNLSGAATVRDLALNRSTPTATALPGAVTACGATVSACGATDAGQRIEGDGISAADLGSHIDGPLDLVDVRTGAEFRAAHVRGARHVSLEAVTPEIVRAGRPVAAHGPTFLLCKTGGRARMAASKLRAAGIDCIVVDGGTDACAEAGLPIERDASSKTWSIDRQVRLVAGLMGLVGVSIGYFVHPAGYALAAFVGAGLTFAGLTDFCGMALLLGRCPWNK